MKWSGPKYNLVNSFNRNKVVVKKNYDTIYLDKNKIKINLFSLQASRQGKDSVDMRKRKKNVSVKKFIVNIGSEQRLWQCIKMLNGNLLDWIEFLVF